jgi:membrane-associated phospholipid phosphatase
MQWISDLGIQLILLLQGLGDGLAPLMKGITLLGDEEFFLLIMPALYWCIDAGVGLKAGVILLASDSLNTVIKFALHSPRPYLYDPRVRALSTEPTFGPPSGHAQDATAIWGFLAVTLGRRWGWITAILLVFLIGLSRVYLGVHFPADVILGWLLGGLVLWGFLRFEPLVRDRIASRSTFQKLAVSFSASLLILLAGVTARALLGSWSIPAEWIRNAAISAPGTEPFNPLLLDYLVLDAGALFGLLAGAILVSSWGGFNTSGSLWHRLARFPIGLVGVVLIWYGLGRIFPRGDFLAAYGLRYLRYALVGFWISGLAPLIYIRLGIARPHKALTDQENWAF